MTTEGMLTFVWRTVENTRGSDSGTLAQLRTLARKRVGSQPELGHGYAVASDGIVTIWPQHPLTLRDLFPQHPDLADLKTGYL